MRLTDLLEGSEDGFANVQLQIVSRSQLPTDELALVVRGSYEGEVVGLRIVLGRTWRPATLGGDIPVHWGTLNYQSIGDESDKFVQAISGLYGLPRNGMKMQSDVRFTALVLQGQPDVHEPLQIKTKLFFESDEGDNAEIYTNIDTESGQVVLREKDSGYREAIIAAIGNVSR